MAEDEILDDTNPSDPAEPAPAPEPEGDQPAMFDEPTGDGPQPAAGEESTAERILRVARALVAAQIDDNQRVGGELVLHYPSRDVTVVIDGDAGLRIMRLFLDPNATRLADPMGPGSDANDGWLALDLDQLMAVSWGIATPGPTRLAVDPPAAA